MSTEQQNSWPGDPINSSDYPTPVVPPDIEFNLSQNNIAVGHTSPECSFFVPLVVASLVTKLFLGLHKRKNMLVLRGNVNYKEE